MADTLGSLIGKVQHSFSVKNEAEEKVQLNVTFDFTSSSDIDIRSWLCGNRAIVLQRPLRALSISEIKALNSSVIEATHAGRKVQSATEKVVTAIRALRAIGQNDAADELEAKLNEKDEKAEDKNE